MVLLPNDLMIEILLELQVKSLVRFGSVNKSWLHFITDSDFAKLHYERSTARGDDRLMLIASSAFVPEVQSIDINAPSFHDDSATIALTMELPAPRPYYHSVEIIASCRGFLLLHCLHHLCVWNPATGVQKIVALPPVFFKTNAVFYTVLIGFGYDPSKDDYLVLNSSYNPQREASRVEIFSLRANEWKGFEGDNVSYSHFYNPNNPGIFYNQHGSFLNGAIHWLAFNTVTSMNVVVAFDLVERSFSEMHLPVEFDYDNFMYCHLKVFGELLSLCVSVGDNNLLEIWVMKEYKVCSSWTKTIVFSVDDNAARFFFPMCITKKGDIIGTNHRAGLTKFNEKGQLQDHRSYGLSEVVVYTESLFSLP